MAELSSSSIVRAFDASVSRSCLKTDFKNEQERLRIMHRFSGEMYPKHISKYMLMTSVFMILGAIYAVQCKCYSPSVSVVLTVLLSINYWRKPTKGIRRAIDIANAMFNIFYHWVYAIILLDYEISIRYTGMIVIALFLFRCGRWCTEYGLLYYDALFHCTLHVYGTVGNCWLYTQIYRAGYK